MADADKIIKVIKGAGKVIKKIAKEGAPLLATLSEVSPFINKAGQIINDKTEKNKNLVIVPRLYSKNVRILAEQAKLLLEERELKPQLFPVEKNIKYKDCIEYEVVESDPRENQKVEKGSFVNVYYITANTIEESKEIYKELERRKAEVQAEKARKKAEEQADNDRKKAEKAEEYLIKTKKMAEEAERRADKAKQKAKISNEEAEKAKKIVDETQKG